MQRKKRESDHRTDILLVGKEVGETMGQLLSRVKTERGIEATEKLTYAGRLDPLAKGLVLLLKGSERFNKEKFLNLDKEYEFDLVFGIETDTGDPLGKIQTITQNNLELQDKLEQTLKDQIGKQLQHYPLYSSRPVNGKPLFMYAREGKEVRVPERAIQIYSIECLQTFVLKRTEFTETVQRLVSSVSGDFRQKEILKNWDMASEQLPRELFVAHIALRASSGTYVRVLAQKIACEMGTVGLAMNIYRSAIGGFTLSKSVV